MGIPDLAPGGSSPPSSKGSGGEIPMEALGNLSHDLNNALSVVLTSSTSLLRREPVDQTAHRQLELVHRSALRIHDLTEQLNDALAVQSGQFELKLAPLETRQVMQEAVEAAQQLAKQRTLRLRGGDSPLWIRGDLLRLQRVFAHLLRSALSATLEGTVEVALERRATEACVKIHDGGKLEATHPAADLSTSSGNASFLPSETQRLSLARYVSHGVLLAHGGRLWIEPQHEGGSAFLVCVPITEHPPAARLG
jgi:signal transduction histidine kinase